MRNNEQVLEFLLFSYFGLGVDMIEDITLENEIIRNCIKRAYLDLCRTIKFTTNEHIPFVERVENIMFKEITESLFKTNEVNYDEWHNRNCVSICDIAKESKSCVFFYGQAQKWVNMTLKYIWFLGIEDGIIGKIEEKLHIPIDNYILGFLFEFCLHNKDAFGADEQIKVHCYKERNKVKINISNSNTLSFTIYKDGNAYIIALNNVDTYRWSKISNKDLYISIQKVLKAALNIKYPNDVGKPLCQENKAWLSYAKKRKSISI